MILTEGAAIFKQFLTLCGMRDSSNIFPTFYADAEEGSLHVWAKTSTEFARIVYTPNKIEMDKAIAGDASIWGDIEDLLTRFKFFKGEEVKIVFDAERFNVETTATKKRRFGLRNIDKDTGREDNPSAYAVWEAGKGFDKFETKKAPFKAVFLNADDKEVIFDFAHVLTVDVSDIQDIVAAKGTLTNPSYYKLRTDAAGIVSIVVLDDDDERKGDDIVADLGKILYEGKGFSIDFRSGFENAFKNLSGTVDLYFGEGNKGPLNPCPMIIHQNLNDSSKKEVFDVTYLIMDCAEDKEEPEPETKEAPAEKPKKKGGKKPKEPEPEEEVEDSEETEAEPDEDEDVVEEE
jgi:hypothetical protein